MGTFTDSTKLSFRPAGWSSVTSGILGILSFAILIYAVATRTTWEITDKILLLINLHNLINIFQVLLLIPVLFAIRNLSRIRPPIMSNALMITGVTALCLSALFHLFFFPRIMSDEYYMIPQGVFGYCLAIIFYQLQGIFKRALRWFGIIVGVGLMLVAIYEIGFGLFVDISALQIPAVELTSVKDPGPTTANVIVHFILDIGTFIGVLPLPILSIILGRKLLVN